MKRLTKKLKDISVAITFAESKEYDTAKENVRLGKTATDVASKVRKEQKKRMGKNNRRKEVMSSGKKRVRIK